MSRNYRINMKKVYVNYDQVHRDTRNLYEQIESISPNGVILIAVARGGWITSRILAASYEENGTENHSYRSTLPILIMEPPTSTSRSPSLWMNGQ